MRFTNKKDTKGKNTLYTVKQELFTVKRKFGYVSEIYEYIAMRSHMTISYICNMSEQLKHFLWLTRRDSHFTHIPPLIQKLKEVGG